MKTASDDFFPRTRNAKKIMVLDLGFLGDTVHLLPSLWMVRQAWPEAELHVTVASHITSFMSCTPWVDRVWGYMRYPRHATLRENFDMIRGLRRERFDVLINLNGSDRSSWLTFFSGARERLGRVPDDGGPPFWKHMFTAHVDYPFASDPIYLQRCRCLEKAGFPASPPEFHVEIGAEDLRPAEISESERGSYFHISPFTTADYKELAPEQLAELIAALGQHFPDKKIALSCAPTGRELAKMEKLLSLLPQKPWRLFAGNLNLIQIAAVIKYSALHFCGDTGTFHLAVMTQTPVAGWFWPNPGIREWVPQSEKCRVVAGTNPPGTTFLANVSTNALIEAAKSALSAV
jgi:heptosyltransferase-3